MCTYIHVHIHVLTIFDFLTIFQKISGKSIYREKTTVFLTFSKKFVYDPEKSYLPGPRPLWTCGHSLEISL